MAADNTDATDAINDQAGPPVIETETELFAYVSAQLSGTDDDDTKAELLTNIALAAFRFAAATLAATEAQRKAASERFYSITQAFDAPRTVPHPLPPQWCVMYATPYWYEADGGWQPLAGSVSSFHVSPWGFQMNIATGPFATRFEAEQSLQQKNVSATDTETESV